MIILHESEIVLEKIILFNLLKESFEMNIVGAENVKQSFVVSQKSIDDTNN